MAKYTMYLRDLCDLISRENVEKIFKNYDINDYLTKEQISVIETSGVWNKDRLAKKIVNHYLMHELGQETPGLFKLYAENMMNEIMEAKLPLIYSSAIKYDPLVNVDFTETFERDEDGTTKNDGTSVSNANSKSTGLAINSDTPQGQINKESILNGTYASDTSANDTETNANDNTSILNNEERKTKEKYIKKMKGNSGVSATAQKMIEQYRNNIIAIDKEIIEELNILFMGLF